MNTALLQTQPHRVASKTNDICEIALIDSRVGDIETLLAGVRPGVRAIVLDPNRNGIEQIGEVLDRYGDLRAIHLVAHGEPGGVQLGNGWLRWDRLEGDRAALARWFGSGSAPPDLLIYGCNVAQGAIGAAFVRRLSEITGANVAASATRTGNSGLGGDWNLEVTVGDVQGAIAFLNPFQDAYSFVLNTYDAADVNELIAAINSANTDGGASTINLTGTNYTLTNINNSLGSNSPIEKDGGNNGLPVIGNDGSLTIEGNGATIERSSADNFRIFFNNGATVTLNDLTLDGGKADIDQPIKQDGSGDPEEVPPSGDSGGAIFNAAGGNFTLNNVTLSNNEADFGGGAILNDVGSTLIVLNSDISDNIADAGAGIFNRGASNGLTITNTDFSGNQANEDNKLPLVASVTGKGGALFNASDNPATIENSEFSGNTAEIEGAGIYITAAGKLTIESSTISNNTAGENGGGIYFLDKGDVDLIQTTLSGNTATNGDGGGIYIFDDTDPARTGTLNITESTISSNTANNGSGSGIFNNASLEINSSTLSANASGFAIANDTDGNANITNSTLSGNDRGIDNTGTITVTNNTIVYSTGIGVNNNGGNFTIDNTIVAGSGTDVMGDFTSNGANIIGNVGGNGSFGGDIDLSSLPDGIGDVINTTLAGGPPQTHVLVSPTSIAIDRGLGSLATDQNGKDRLLTVDIGAVEAGDIEINVKIDSGNILDETGSFDFGEYSLGSDAIQTFTIENLGDLDLTLENPTFSDSEFSLEGSFPTTIAGGSEATFQVRFDTSAVVDINNATISFENNDVDEDPYNFTLLGEVTDNNQPPELTVANQTATAGQNFSYTPTATDPEDDALTFSATVDGTPIDQISWLDIDPNTGEISGTPPAGQAGGTLEIEVTADDGNNGTDVETFDLTIEDDTNNPPVLTVEDQTANAEEDFSYTPTASDADNDDLTFSATVDGTPIDQIPWLEIDPDTGEISGTPPADQAGETFDIQVTADDGNGGTAVDAFQLEIGDVGNNDPILDDPIEDRSLPEGESLNFNPGENFSDPDGDDLTFSATLADGSPLPAWIDFNEDTGELTADPPDGIAIETLDIEIVADDGNGGEPASDNFSLTVGESDNTEPTAKPLNDQTGTEGTPLSFTIPDDTFTDPDGDPLDITVQLANGEDLPEWLDFDADTGTFSGTPPEGSPPDFDIQVKADDGNGGKVSSSFTLSIADPTDTDDGNDPPVLDNPVADRTIEEGDPLNFTVPANTFSDPDGDPLTYTATLADGSPLPNGLTFDPDTRTFSGTPEGLDALDRLSLKVTADDGNGGMAMDVFDVSINTPGNNPPTVDADPDDQTGDPGDPLDFDLPPNLINDDDGDDPEVTASLANGDPLPPWLNFDPDTGKFTGEPPEDAAGETFPIQISADDGKGGITSKTFDLTIGDPNEGNGPPVLDNPVADRTIEEGDPLNFTVPANTFSDPDGDPLTYTATLADGSPLPNGLTFDPATRTFSGTPEGLDALDRLSLKVTADDGNGGMAMDVFDVSINTPGNNPPTVDADPDDQTGDPGDPLDFDVPLDIINDDDGDDPEVTASLANGDPLPPWLNFDPDTGKFTGEPPEDAAGQTFPIQISADDGKGGITSKTFDLTIGTPTDSGGGNSGGGGGGGFPNLGGGTPPSSGGGNDSGGGDGDGDSEAPPLTLLQGDTPIFGGDDDGDGDGGDGDGDGGFSGLDFGSSGINDPLVQTLTLQNPGNEPLPLSDLQLPEGFSLVGEFPDTIPPGGEIEFQIQLDADATGNPNGLLSFVAGDGTQFEVPISGTVLPFDDREACPDCDCPEEHSLDLAQPNLSDAPFDRMAFTQLGNDDSDIFIGSVDGDNLQGFGGDDILTGGLGADIIRGGKGSDVPIGPNGDRDMLFGNQNNDWIFANEGEDTVHAGQDNDNAWGGKDNDMVIGDRGNDILMGDLGDDTVVGGTIDEVIRDTDGTDMLMGGGGRDLVVGNEGNDSISGGGDDDTLHGGQNDDRVMGDAGNDLVIGDVGNDSLSGGEGNDTAIGSNGKPQSDFDRDRDFIMGDAGDDLLLGNEGDDTIKGGDDNDLIRGGRGDDQLFGDPGHDLMFGDLGDDTLCAHDGDDTLLGSNGNPPDGADDGSDVMLAGAGEDILLGNEGDDTLDGGEDDDLLHGGRGNDRLEGNSGNDAILGDLGNDTIDGGEGEDTIVASNGGMTEEVADEADVVSGGAGDDWVAANRGNDVVNGGQGDDTLYGGQEDDSLTGGIGDDVLYGDLGDDTVTGGHGSDRFVLTLGGTDTIVDFEDGTDAFVLTGELTFAQLDITVNETSDETSMAETSVSLSFNEEVFAIVQGVGAGAIAADDFVSLESD